MLATVLIPRRGKTGQPRDSAAGFLERKSAKMRIFEGFFRKNPSHLEMAFECKFEETN